MLHRNTKIRPLEEELAEIGLDPEKTLSQIHRSTKLVERRMTGGNGGGMPNYLRSTEPTVETEEEPGDEVEENTEAEGVALSEALKVIKVRRLSSSQKAKGKRIRRKTRGKRRMASKLYRKRMRRRIQRVGKIKRKRFGAAGLAKLHKGRRKIVMSAESPLANLREELNKVGESAVESSPHEDAAFNAGLLAMYIGEMFEAFGDAQSAETMYDTSDAAADLAEKLIGRGSEDEMTEEESDLLERILDTLVKGLRMYEAMGAPSLSEVLDFVAEGEDEDEDEDEAEGGDDEDADEDEDEEDDDEDEDDEG